MHKQFYFLSLPLAFVLFLAHSMMANERISEVFPEDVRIDGNREWDSLVQDTLELSGDEDENEEKRHEWLIAPIPSYNPTLGWTLTVPVTLLYHPRFVSRENPVWATGGGGFYSENGSWGVGLLHRMNLQDDQWRFLLAPFYADVTYKFYGTGGDAGNPGNFLRLGQRFGGGRAKVLRRLSENLYFGLRFTGFNTEIHSVRLPSGDSPELKPPWFDINVQVNTIAPVFVYDSRDNEFYPTKGHFGHLEIDFSDETWGSDFDYQFFNFDWNHYRSISEKGVLAFRGVVKYATDDTPFFLLPAVGKGSDLRGYPSGLYRDQILLSGQVEYRHRLTDRIGLVAFAGIAGVAPDWDAFDTGLPSFGGGVRWVVAPQNDISLRLDYARGRDGSEVYVSIGEAF